MGKCCFICIYLYALIRSPQPFWHQGLVSWKTISPRTGVGEWFQDDSSTLHLLCTLFLLLFCQLHLRSSGMRSWRLGIPALNNFIHLINKWASRCSHVIVIKTDSARPRAFVLKLVHVSDKYFRFTLSPLISHTTCIRCQWLILRMGE